MTQNSASHPCAPRTRGVALKDLPLASGSRPVSSRLHEQTARDSAASSGPENFKSEMAPRLKVGEEVTQRGQVDNGNAWAQGTVVARTCRAKVIQDVCSARRKLLEKPERRFRFELDVRAPHWRQSIGRFCSCRWPVRRVPCRPGSSPGLSALRGVA